VKTARIATAVCVVLVRLRISNAGKYQPDIDVVDISTVPRQVSDAACG
jgi:hypothetical protein